MALQRKAVRKRIALPNGEHVFVPCLEQIPFSVAADQYQEHVLYLRNGLDANRAVHIRDVPNIDNDASIAVERIDKLFVKTMAEQAQERTYYLKNLDPPPILPDGTNNPAHEKVHYVRYFKDNDSNSDVWADVELIDTLKITVAAEQYQEWLLYLRHDVAGDVIGSPGVSYGPVTVGFCDPSFQRSNTDNTDIDPPYRLDPFQNIIQFNGGAATATEPFDIVWARPAPSPTNPSGAWSIWDTGELPQAVDDGFAYWINGTSPGPQDYDFDLRFADQFFDPKTYDNTGTGALGTGDVRGYTHSEWTIGFAPPPGYPTPGAPPVGLNGLWWYQLQAYEVANPSPHIFPNEFDFPAYGAADILTPPYVTWRDLRAGGFTGLDNPVPVARIRMTVIGTSTTANPSGRY